MKNRKKVENYLLSTAGRFLNKSAIEKHCKIPVSKINNFLNEKRKYVHFTDAEIEVLHNFFAEVMFYEYN